MTTSGEFGPRGRAAAEARDAATITGGALTLAAIAWALTHVAPWHVWLPWLAAAVAVAVASLTRPRGVTLTRHLVTSRVGAVAAIVVALVLFRGHLAGWAADAVKAGVREAVTAALTSAPDVPVGGLLARLTGRG